LRESARAIIEAVVRLGQDQRLPEVPLQPRISFSIPPTNGDALGRIEPATSVTGYDNALTSIFRVAGSTTTWGNFKEAAKLQNTAVPLWLEDVEQGVCQHVAKGLVPPQTDVMCVSGGSMFRPIITRFVPYQSGKKDVYVIFSPVQRRPLFNN